ncbi:cyclin-dependent kinase inhibitor 1B-like [Ischnura elegans]|uniref:cyclin-dependent kinase inhibitor 1B-like n=1 Tax=Ischnura elegans TaxID=197161 RepID=UPI001ED88EEE|nr:cyclin-dependent kinase inhibitor 1B-like [Ischnura elegans]
MSARVFNAFPLFEMRGAMRGVGVDGFSGDRRSRIRANLFGPVDHEEVKRALETELAEQAKRDSKKYNFDFLAERPTSGDGGRYEWDVATVVPAPYELRGMPYIHAHTAADEATTTTVVGASSAASGSSSAQAATTTVKASSRPLESSTAAMKQSRITDFHQKRKRLLTKEKSSSPASPASTPSEQTVFKKARVQKS